MSRAQSCFDSALTIKRKALNKMNNAILLCIGIYISDSASHYNTCLDLSMSQLTCQIRPLFSFETSLKEVVTWFYERWEVGTGHEAL